jgi:hypothetical protein
VRRRRGRPSSPFCPDVGELSPDEDSRVSGGAGSPSPALRRPMKNRKRIHILNVRLFSSARHWKGSVDGENGLEYR